MSTEPRIYLKNYIDSNSNITPVSGSSTKNRIFDRDRDVQWSSSGNGTDGGSAGITVTFKTLAGVVSQKTIDTIILLNHNFLDVFVQSSPDNVTYTNQGTSVGTGNDIISLTPVSAAYWFIRATNTIVANQEKKIGELIYTSLLLTPGVELDSYDVSYRQMAPEIPLADGSVHRTVIKWTESRSAKYEFSGRMSYLTFTQLESLRTLKESGAAFYWQPESITRPQELYYVNWTGPFRFRYVTSYKSAGYQVDFQFKEV